MDKNKFKYSMVLTLRQQDGDACAPNHWGKVDEYCTFEETFKTRGDKILRRVVSMDRTLGPITPGTSGGTRRLRASLRTEKQPHFLAGICLAALSRDRGIGMVVTSTPWGKRLAESFRP